MMLMLLLSELTRLQIHLSVASNGLHVQAPIGVLCDELRLAMAEHKTALMRYASLPYVIADDVGILTGNRLEQDITFVAPERQEVWRYNIGVMSLSDGVERFYWPRMVLQARPEDLPDVGGTSLRGGASNTYSPLCLLYRKQVPGNQAHSGSPPFYKSLG